MNDTPEPLSPLMQILCITLFLVGSVLTFVITTIWLHPFSLDAWCSDTGRCLLHTDRLGQTLWIGLTLITVIVVSAHYDHLGLRRGKLYPGADVPEFTFDSRPDGTLRMGYDSHRRMCSFAEGLILGAAAQFGEHATVVQPQCMLRGDDWCVLEIGFSPGTAS